MRILKSLGIDPTRKVRLRASMVRRAPRMARLATPGSAARPCLPFRSYTLPVTPPREALGLSAAAWDALALEWGLPRYRGRQIFDAIQRRGARDYAAMRELPGDLRERLAREVPILLPEIARREEAADGSVKYALRLADGALIEAVYMPGDAGARAANEFDGRADLAGASKVQRPRSPKVDAPRSNVSPSACRRRRAARWTACSA